MCLAGELLWKRAAPEPFSLDQDSRVVAIKLLREFREHWKVQAVKSIPSFLAQEMRGARSGRE